MKFNYNPYALSCAREEKNLPQNKHVFIYKNRSSIPTDVIMDCYLNHEGYISDSPLIGKRFIKENTIFTIQTVRICNYQGLYLQVVAIDPQESSTVQFWENISCHSSIIIDCIVQYPVF